VIFTKGRTNRHFMQMYDVRRKNPNTMWSWELEPFESESDVNCVNCARFSPDMMHLAVARSDNITHIYDSRMINRGILHTFKHTGRHRNMPGSEPFGSVEARWVETSATRLGLVTGGSDGE
jgi:hypothetical protein